MPSISGRFSIPWLPASANFTSSSLCSYSADKVRSCALAVVLSTELIRPASLSTQMWTFIPKSRCFPSQVWCVPGSRSPALFLVEQGIAIKVAIMLVPSFLATAHILR